MSFKKLGWCFAAVACLASACTGKQSGSNDPKGRLNEYISQSFAVRGVQDRLVLASYMTGDAKSRIESWSDEQFRTAFVESKRQFIKLAFKEEKAVSDSEVGITYELTYQSAYGDAQGKSHDAKITNKKYAQMVRENGKWFIREVRNIKELVEYKNEMSLP